MDLSQLKEYAELALMLLGALCVLATVVVRIIPGQKDDEALARVFVWIKKVFQYAPTLGLNPGTKALIKKLEELEK